MEGGSNTPYKQEEVKFDASQYEFFGKNVTELELGESYDEISVPGNAKGKYVGSSSSANELATTFGQLIMINEPRNSSSIIQKPSFPYPPGFNRYKEPVPHGRLYGTVKWYSDERGYGFLTSTDSKNDIFVHSSSLKTDGCIHLSAGTGVEFEVVSGWDRKLQAINVTAPGGRLLRDTRKVGPHGGNSTTNESCDGGCSSGTSVMSTAREVGPCFTCGQWGHLAKDCSHIVAKNDPLCYICGNMGHLVTHCPFMLGFRNDGF